MKTLLLLLMLWALPCFAHEVRPAYLELTETEPGTFSVVWKVPANGGPALAGDDIPHPADPAPLPDSGPVRTLPCGCPVPTAADLLMGVLPIHPLLPKYAEIVSLPRIERLPGAQVKRWSVSTGAQGLNGQEIRIHGLEATMIDVLVRITFADGRAVSRLLRPESPAFNVEAGDGSTARQFLVLGVEHILLGIDHLLFVLGLLLIVRGAGRLVKTITAFTIAHSITLALATLGIVHVPGPPVEAVIALSIVFVAREAFLMRTGGNGENRETKSSVLSVSSCSNSLTARQPWLVAFTFGLLHGFGFAGALSEVGLPPNEVPAALLFFNIGVELGQLLFIAAVCLVILYARRFRQAFAINPPAWTRRLAPYAIGGVAAFWVIERIATF